MALVHRIAIGCGILCCVFGVVNFGQGDVRRGAAALGIGAAVLLVSWHAGRMRRERSK